MEPKDIILNPILISETIACILAIIVGNRDTRRLFLPYLLLTISLKFAGFYSGKSPSEPNMIFFNINILLQAIFCTLLFCIFYPSQWMRRVAIGSFIVFLVFFLVEITRTPISAYNLHSRQLLSFEVVLLCCLFYFSLIRNDSVLDPLSFPPFWIVTGLFFYYFGSMGLFAFRDSVAQLRLSNNISIYTLVIAAFNLILYGNWIIGFVCMKRQHPPSRQ